MTGPNVEGGARELNDADRELIDRHEERIAELLRQREERIAAGEPEDPDEAAR